jgi:hypothetical protein
MRSSKWEKARDVLEEHMNEDTLELDTSGYYQGLIQTFSIPDFREQLDIACVFPKTQFYGLCAFLDADDALCFRKHGDSPGPNDFRLIIRSHQHDIDML